MRLNFYELIGVPTYATQHEIAVAVREKLAVSWGDERELLINAANTLLDRESRESYDRLNGITKTRGREQVISDSAAAVAGYAEAERARGRESSFTELKWTLNFIALGVVIGLWLLMMFQMVPAITAELNKFLIASRDFNVVFAFLLLTLPSLGVAYLAMNLFSESLHITLRYFLLCAVLGGIIWWAGGQLMSPSVNLVIRMSGVVGLTVCTVMFLRYWGVRQVNSIGNVEAARSRRRDQHE